MPTLVPTPFLALIHRCSGWVPLPAGSLAESPKLKRGLDPAPGPSAALRCLKCACSSAPTIPANCRASPVSRPPASAARSAAAESEDLAVRRGRANPASALRRPTRRPRARGSGHPVSSSTLRQRKTPPTRTTAIAAIRRAIDPVWRRLPSSLDRAWSSSRTTFRRLA